MRSTLRLADGRLEWFSSPGVSPGRRNLTDEDHSLFDAWTERYRKVLKKLSPREDLSVLGQEMYRWLDGGDSWLRQVHEAGIAPPWIVDFEVPAEPNPLETAFLEAPWELLHDGKSSLAGNQRLIFCPVRRFGRPGTEELPSPDRLSGVFMTALPEGASVLDVEAEENGILKATAGVGMDLAVEDSGNLERLGQLLGRLGRVDVIHLSCHGSLKPPALLLEDDYGGPARADANQIQSTLQPHRPRLLFLSACETAGSNQWLGALAPTLVQRGLPGLLGWGGSVGDVQASDFAADLYKRLSNKGRLDESVAWARLALLSKPSGAAGDWHLARLLVSATGGGLLATGNRKRDVRDIRQTAKTTFLDARRQIPVASPEEFVGRRRDLQRALRTLRDGDGKLGILLHGIGRQGKSSLALRILQRMPDHRAVVLYGPFDGGALLDAVADAVAAPEVRALVDAKREEVARSEEILADVLVRLLEEHCAQKDEQRHRPLLFVLDDFEQLLEENEAPPCRLKPRFVGPVRALFRALERAATDSRLLVTSRYTFTLPGQRHDLAQNLVFHALPRMSNGDRRKQLWAKLNLFDDPKVDPEILPRLLKAAQGNPGLQDLLTVLLLESPERAESAISAMEAHLAGEEAPDQQDLVAFLSNLALENLIALLSPEERELLRISTLFSLPVPEPVMEQLAKGAGLSPSFDRLTGLGLWEVYSPDSGVSLLASGLVRPHVEELSEEERRGHAERIVELLFEAWGGTGKKTSRSYSQDLELTNLAFLAEDGRVVAACAEDAVTALERGNLNREAAALGLAAIALLDKKNKTVPIGLLRKTAELCVLIGDTAAARELYGRAKDAFSKAQALDELDQAAVLISHSRLLTNDGQIDEALEGFEKARDLLAKAEQTREVAITLSDIARIKVNRGEVDEALKLHEEVLRVYEALGDAQSRAVTLGYIARIKDSRGEVDEGLKLHEEKLRIVEALGDARSRAVTLGDIARIKRSRGEVDEALKLHEERLRVFEALGDPRERAVALGDIARIKVSRKEVDEALKLHEEVLRVYEALGDLDGKAHALWSLAQIHLSKEDFQHAFESLAEAYRISLELRRLDGICYVGWDLGRLLCAGGAVAQGRVILERSLAGLRHLRREAMAQMVEEFLTTLPPGEEDADAPPATE